MSILLLNKILILSTPSITFPESKIHSSTWGIPKHMKGLTAEIGFNSIFLAYLPKFTRVMKNSGFLSILYYVYAGKVI